MAIIPVLKDPYGIREKYTLTRILDQWEKDKDNLKRQITDMGLTLSYKGTKTA